jgi:HAE1 family hydrophobic/amphiphilic exporter-1
MAGDGSEAVPATTDSPVFRAIVSRPVAVTMSVVAVCVFGAVSLQKLPVTLLPEMSFPTLTIRTEFPGAAPGEVEELVTKPMEDNVAVVSNLTGYRSVSRAGGCDVILEFAWKTPMTFAVQEVREKLDQLQTRLPRGVERPLVLRYDPTFDPILRIGLSGEADLFQIRSYAEDELKRKLETTPGVAAVKVKGGFEKEIRVELSEEALRHHRVSLAAINERLAAENVNVASGILRDGDVEYMVRTLNEFRTPAEIGGLVVAMQGGQPVRLRELGAVTQTNKERDVITRIDGLESVEIEIHKEADANLVAVAKAVKARLFGKAGVPPPQGAQSRRAATPGNGGDGGPGGPDGDGTLASDLPPTMKLRILSDQSVFIEESIDEVKKNAVEGAILAVLVLYAFLRRYKPTLIIAVSIPVSILATFAPLAWHGVSLNVMSLGGLAIGVGMIVDDSIVVLEAIERRRERGESAFWAAVNGTREMALAVTATTLTTVIVFVPIVFVEGVAGQMFRDQALAVVYSLLASMVVAMVVVPMLGALAPRKPLQAIAASRLAAFGGVAAGLGSLRRVRDGWKKRGLLSLLWTIPMLVLQLPLEAAARLVELVVLVLFMIVAGAVRLIGKVVSIVTWPFLWLFDRGFRAFQAGLELALKASLRARLLTVAVSGVLTWLAFNEMGSLKHDLVPPMRQGLFTLETQLDVGTPVEQTDARTRELAGRVRGAIERAGIGVDSISSQVGVARDAIAKPGEGSHSSKLFIHLKPSKKPIETENAAREAVRVELAHLSGIGVPVIDAPALFQTRTPLEAEIVGHDRRKTAQAAILLEAEVARIDGVVSARSTVRRGRPEIVIRFDREALARYSLKLGDVAETIRNKVQGVVATRFTERERKIDVRTRLPERDLTTAATLERLQINPGSTPPLPLSAVASIEVADGPAEIRHVGGRRAEIVSADLAGLDLRGAGRAVEERAAALRTTHRDVFDQVVVRLAGQNEEAARSMDSLLFALALATFLTYLVMAAQFESLLHPFVIMLTIPLALIGVVFAMRLFSISVSVMVFIGGILLVGVVVDNAIILIDKVNVLRRSGWMRDAALVEAARVRLRPIAMTMATTALGLVPLALGLGEGAELRQPMAIVVIAGLASSTLLTLVVIPVIYSLFSRSGPIREQQT